MGERSLKQAVIQTGSTTQSGKTASGSNQTQSGKTASGATKTTQTGAKLPETLTGKIQTNTGKQTVTNTGDFHDAFPVQSDIFSSIPSVRVTVVTPNKIVTNQDTFPVTITITQTSSSSGSFYDTPTNLPISGIKYFTVHSQLGSEKITQNGETWTKISTISYKLQGTKTGTYDIGGESIKFWRRKEVFINGTTIHVLEWKTKTNTWETGMVATLQNARSDFFDIRTIRNVVDTLYWTFFIMVATIIIYSIALYAQKYITAKNKNKPYIPKTLQEYEGYIRFILEKTSGNPVPAETNITQIISYEINSAKKKILSEILHLLISEQFRQKNFGALTTVPPDLMVLLRKYEDGNTTFAKEYAAQK